MQIGASRWSIGTARRDFGTPIGRRAILNVIGRAGGRSPPA
jgi:hypothetical protein